MPHYPQGTQPAAVITRPKVPQGIGFEDDFAAFTASTTANAATYRTRNGAGTGSTTSASLVGGGGVVTTGTTANNNTSISLPGEQFQTQTSGRLLFQARFKVEDADQANFFIGLHEDGTLTNGDVLSETTFDGIGFYANHASAGTATLKYAVGNGSSHTVGSTSITLADDTFVSVSFEVVDRSRVKFWVPGVADPYEVTTTIPTNILTLIAQMKTLDTGGDDLTLDFWQVSQDLIRT